MQFIPDDHRFTDLQLHFYPSFDGSTTIKDADPKTRAYLQGVYAETKVSVSSKGKNIKVIFEKPVGKTRLVPSNRKIQLVFHDCEETQQININRQEVKEWKYDPQSRQMTVRSEFIFSRGKSRISTR
jgi:hypothetical protein